MKTQGMKFLIVFTFILSMLTPLPETSAARLPNSLADWQNAAELKAVIGPWTGRWIKRGQSNIYDAIWSASGGQRNTAVMTINITANGLSATSSQSSDGSTCQYTGTFGKNHINVSGTFTCDGKGPYRWSGGVAKFGLGASGGSGYPEGGGQGSGGGYQPPLATALSTAPVWNETESGLNGVWTRRGSSNVFDAVWTRGAERVTATMEINISGSTVQIRRYNSSDQNDCMYIGTMSGDGKTVSGRSVCSRVDGCYNWSARAEG